MIRYQEDDQPVMAHRSGVTTSCMIAVSIVFFVVGISMITSPGKGGGPLGVIVGAAVIVGAVYIFGLASLSRLVVTRQFLISWYGYRRKQIPWSSVQSFRIGRSRSLITGPMLVIQTDSGGVSVQSICGSARFVRGMINELERYKAVNVSKVRQPPAVD